MIVNPLSEEASPDVIARESTFYRANSWIVYLRCSYLCAPSADWVPLIQPQEFQRRPGLQPDPLLQNHFSGPEGSGQERSPSLSGCFKGNKNKERKLNKTSQRPFIQPRPGRLLY